MNLSHKHLAAFLLTLSLAILPSCREGGSKTTAQQSLAEATAISQRVTQQLTGQPVSNPSSNNNPQFAPPIQCTLGQDCFILLYPDRDPSPAVVDFGCGRQTYEGHDGTDFAIPDEAAMKRGVPVVAAAPGTVLRARDGVADQRVRGDTDKQNIEGIECGNGVIIDHGNGWQAQYCHFRKGSLAVKPGDSVQKGSELGMVGASGLASFPHVHITIRYQGQPVDPFVGLNAPAGCQGTPHPIWDRPLAYVPTGLIRAGFATQQPDMEQLWQGRFSEAAFPANSPALIFWVFAYGVLQGDQEHYQLFDPNGQIVADNKNEIKSPSRTWVGFIGKRNTQQRPLTPGIWRAEYRLTRGNKVLINDKREVQLYQ